MKIGYNQPKSWPHERLYNRPRRGTFIPFWNSLGYMIEKPYFVMDETLIHLPKNWMVI